MRTLALVLLLVACGSSPPPDPPPEPPPDPGRPVEPSSDGVPENCPFRVGDACYDTSEAACAAAGCAVDSCRILESYPARIRCD
jgi:hypothetical protein